MKWQDQYGIFYGILFGNIFMAVANEFLNGSTFFPTNATLKALNANEFNNGSILNTLAGAILLFTLPGSSSFKMVQERKYPDIHYNLGWLWLICFTFWSFTFGYSYTLVVSSPIICFDLLLPLILAGHRQELYVQYRAFVYAMVMFIWVTPPLRNLVVVKDHVFEPIIYIVFIFITMLGSFMLLLDSWNKQNDSLLNFILKRVSAPKTETPTVSK